ncbi:MAG: lysostaphin resistance A-like protein [Phycisphaerae bacterium]
MVQALVGAWGLVAQATGASWPAETPTLPPVPSALYVVTILGLIAIVVLAIRVRTRPGLLDLRRTPGRQGSIGPVHVAGVLFLWMAVQLLVPYFLLPVFGMTAQTATQPDNRLALLQLTVIVATASAAALLVASLAAGRITFRLGLVRGMGLDTRHWVYDTLAAVFAFFAVMPVVLGLLELTTAALGALHVKVQEHVVLTALKELGPSWKALAFVGAAVITPPAEELFFRGLVQTMFRQYLGRSWVAIGITSVFFAAMHMETPNAIPSLVALAMVLGYLYERSGRLYSPILLHAIFNTFNMCVELAGQS